jgi:hypothetical protein
MVWRNSAPGAAVSHWKQLMSEEAPQPTDEAVLGQDSSLLESWKEIAAYLKRGVRTVQRWERNEALPVHRHVHDKRGTVYAFRHEIDQWRENRRTLHRRPTGGDGPAARGSTAGIATALRSLFARYPRARLTTRLVALILLGLAVIVAWVRAQGAASPSSLESRSPAGHAPRPQAEIRRPVTSPQPRPEQSRYSSRTKGLESTKRARRIAPQARQQRGSRRNVAQQQRGPHGR